MKYPIPINHKTPIACSTQSEKKVPDIRKSRLGMDFEKMINETNEFYLRANLAVVYKKPTPIQITKVEYPKRSCAKITEGFFQVPSTTDYNGVYKGLYIDFEAKSVSGSTFPLANLHQHQVDHLESVLKHKGIAFLLLMFRKSIPEVFLLDAKFLITYYRLALTGGKKSISYGECVEHGIALPIGTSQVPYLLGVDILIQRGGK